jgi:hypothetical protein
MHKLIAGLAAGLVVLVAAPGALAAHVVVRVEGTPDTLLPLTQTTTTTGTFTKDGSAAHSCSRNSATGALEAATGGNWAGRWASFGDYEIQTIRGETHKSDAGDAAGTYWSFWLNYKFSSTGGCGTPMQDGDDVLFFPSCFGTGCDREPTPLRIAGIPASAAQGQVFGVRVVQYGVTFDSDFNATTTMAPAAGATVTAGGASFTAGADGIAHVRVDSQGVAGVRATKDGFVRSATEPVCVNCGTTPPPGSPGAADTKGPATTLTIKNGKVFTRKKAPRTLKGRVASDPSGLSAVKIRLLRKVGKKCAFFSGGRERWRKTHLCWHGSYFKIGDRASWSYLLPKRLGKGRYILEAYGIDGVLNRGPIKRVKFRVR